MKKVIDANFLSDPKLLFYLKADPENKVVFCDHACMETYKGNVLENIKRSINIVSDYPGQVLVLKGTRDIAKITLHVYSLDQLVDVDQTMNFENFCKAVSMAVKGDASLKDQVLHHQAAAKAHFRNVLLDSEKFKAGIKEMKNTFSSKQLKDLRTDAILDSETAHKMVIDILALTAFLCKEHPDISVLPSTEDVRGSYIFRYSVSGYLLALWWISKGGLDDVQLGKVHNDIVDIGHVAYATLFDGILTNDRKMEQIYQEAIYILEHAFKTSK